MGKRRAEEIEEEEDPVINVDGAQLEGGGQVLRNCISFAALTKRSVYIKRIRGGRKKPGIKNQHLLGINLVTQLFSGEVQGAKVGSLEVLYKPTGKIHLNQSEYQVKAPTAASCCLILQTSLPCALFMDRPIKILYGGGTNASYAPQVDYTMLVFQPMMKRLFNVKFDIEIIRRGFFPQGGGQISLTTHPTDYLPAFDLTNFGSSVKKCLVKVIIAKLERHVAERGARACAETLQAAFPGIEIEYELDESKETGPGAGVLAILETDTGVILGGSGLGAKRKPAEKVGQEAANELIESIRLQICVDKWLQDQLIQFMALAKGVSKMLTGPITMHTKTAIHFSQLMTGAQFEIKEVGENRNIIACKGVGYVNRYYDDL